MKFSLITCFFVLFIAAADGSTCETGIEPHGAQYQACLPDSWNGDLVIYAHGYMAPSEPVELPDDTFPGGITIASIVNRLGFGYATTSYRTNGLVVLEGVQDVIELVDLFTQRFGKPNRVLLVGASEGGLITALAIEQHPEIFSGGLALCGPIGDFRGQIDYISDFRVAFDYFFPGVIPGNGLTVPPEVIANWYTVYEPKVVKAIRRRPSSTAQLLRVTGAAIDENNLQTVAETVTSLLWYHVFASTDAMQKLKGQPFENRKTWYQGSANDLRMNRRIERDAADTAALAEMDAHYETTGKLLVPLVTMHTTLDPIVPSWHEAEYQAKVDASGSAALHYNMYVTRYGHCAFTTVDLIQGFYFLLHKVDTARPPL